MFAYKDILEIHLLHVDSHQLSLNLLKLKIHVTPTLVDPIAILQEQLVIDVIVHVYQKWLVPHQTVDQNVSSTQIVHQRLHVSTENVKIHVLDYVESMLTAESETMFLFVSVIKDSLEIHSLVVTDHQQQHQDQK